MFPTGFQAAVPGSTRRGHAAANTICFPFGTAARGRAGRARRAPGQAGLRDRLSLLAQGLSLRNSVLSHSLAGLCLPAGTEMLVNGDPGSREQQSGKEAPGPGCLQMRQEGITHIPPIRTRVPLEQSRSCLPAQPGLGTGSQLLWERCGSLSHCQHLLKGYFL